MSRRDHDVLFGVLSVQLGLVEPGEVTAIADTLVRDDRTLADCLEADGHINAAQRQALENIVVGTLATNADAQGLEDTLVRLGAAQKLVQSTTTAPSTGQPIVAGDVDERITAEDPGRYALSAEVGRGGLGIVRSSFDRHLGREVAVKELLTLGTKTAAGTPATGTTGEMVARFVREARVTAQLEHPNIVSVYELGRRPDGTLYYTMRLVRGRTLKSALHDAQDLNERLALLSHFVDLCQAIAYAHSRGVIHRDIKPDNVMIGEFGETIVLDWGVAKVRGKDDLRGRELVRSIEVMQGGSSTETLPGAAFGTPAYMSPEQALGRIDDIDERSDVWSLGVVLFQLLTGKIPITGQNLPSLLINVSRGETPPVATVCAEAPRELAAVAERALSADPSDRYQTAKELAHEIEAYRSGAKVSAYEYSSIELVRRFLDRNRPAVVVSLVAALLLMVLGVGAYRRVLDERDRALSAERSSRHNLANAYVEKARGLAQQQSWVGVTMESAAALGLGENADARGLLIDADGRFRPRLRWHARTFAGCLALVGSIATDEVACGTSFGVQLLKKSDGEVAGRIELPGGWVTALAMAPSGGSFAAGNDQGRVALVGRVSREVLARRVAHVGGIRAVVFSGDGRFVYTAGDDGAVRRFRGDDLAPDGIAYARDQAITALAASPTDVALAIGDESGTLTFRGAETIDVEAHDGSIHALAWSREGNLVASAGDDKALLLWDSASAVQLARIPRGIEQVRTLTFDRDGRWLFAGTDEGEVERYDLSTFRLDARAVAHDARIRAVLALGDELYTAGDDRIVRAFVVAPEQGSRAQRFDLNAEGRRLSFVAEGEGLAIVAGPDAIVWDLPARRARLEFGVTIDGPIALSAGAAHLATAEGGAVKVRDFASDVPSVVRRLSGGTVESLALSADGAWLAAGSADGFIRLVSVKGEAEEEVVRAHDGSVDTLVFTPDGHHVVSGGFDGVVRLLPVGKGAPAERIMRHDESASRVAAAGQLVVSSGGDGRVRIYDTEASQIIAEPLGHTGRVRALALSSDARLIATGGDDRMLLLWDARRAKVIARMRDAHPDEIVDVAFSPDDGVLASLGEDGAVRVWSLADLGASRGRLLEAATKTFGVRRGRP